MAKSSIKGITVEIGGNTVGLQKALAEVNTKTRDLNSELRKVEQGLKLDPSNTTLLAQKQQLLSEQVKNTSDKLQQLKAVQNQVEKQYKSGEIGADAYRAFQREIISTENQLKGFENQQNKTVTASDALKAKISEQEKELSTLKNKYSDVVLEQGKDSDSAKELAEKIAALNGDLKQNKDSLTAAEGETNDLTKEEKKLAEEEKELIQKTEKASDETKNLGDSFEKAKTLAKGFGTVVTTVATAVGTAMTAAGGAILAGGAAATKVGMEFESSVSQIQATMGITADNMSVVNEQTINTMDSLKELAKKMGSETSFSAKECADALNYLALAGYDTQQMTDALPTVLNLAAAGNMELAAASDMVTDAMSALGMDVSYAETMVDQMAKTASSTNTSVAQLGEGILKIGATARGIKGGTNELNTALGLLANSSIKGAEGGTHLRNIILSLQQGCEDGAITVGDWLVNIYDGTGKMRSLNDIFIDMTTAMNGLTQESKDAIVSGIFNKTDLAAVNTLLANSGDTWNKLQAEITDSTGAAQQMAETMLDNLQGKITLFQSATSGLGITFFEVMDEDLKEAVELGTNSITKLDEAFQEGGIKAAADAAGEIIADLSTKIAEYIPTIVELAGDLVSSCAKALSDNKEQLVNSAGEMVKSLAEGFANTTDILLNAVIDIGSEVLKQLPNIIDSLLNSGGSFIMSVINFLVDGFKVISEFLPGILKTIFLSITNFLVENIPILFDTINEIVNSVVELLPDLLMTLIDGVLPLIQQLLPTLIDGVLPLIQQLLPTLIDGVLPLIQQLLPTLIDGVLPLIQQLLPTLIDGAVSIIVTLLDNVEPIISAVVAIVPELITRLIVVITQNIKTIANAGVRIFSALVENLPLIIDSIVSVLPTLINSIVTALLVYVPQIIKCGISLLTALIKNLPSIINAIVAELPTIIDAVISGLLDCLPLIINCGVDLFMALIDALPDIIEAICEAMPDIIDGVVEALTDCLPTIIEAGITLFVALIEKMPDIILKICEKVPDIVSSIVDSFKELKSRMSEVGSNLIEGLWDGIEDVKDWISEKISGFCDGVAETIKDFFGIHSPSRLFRDEIGKNLALGIGEGFSDTMNDVTDDMASVLPTSFDMSPQLNLTSDDNRLQTINNNPFADLKKLTVGNTAPQINLTLQIENFNNDGVTSVNELGENIANTFYEMAVRRAMVF